RRGRVREHCSSRRELHVKSRRSKTRERRRWEKNFMPVHRKRFRIEEAFAGALPAAEIPDGVDIGPLHSEIMAELRAIRAQMAGGAASGLMPAAGDPSALRQIAETEAIDQAATALSKNISPDQQKLLSEDIQERVVAIFEACNFQDLTGQRISKVMTTMKFIENHINVMMDIWGGVDAIKSHAPPIVDTREGDARLLNGPKLEGDVGHASQDDIDALFD